MPESSGPDQSTRSEVAPPLVTSKPVQRTGYAVLAASGLVLATAFGGIAELATQPDAGATGELASSPDSGPPRGGQGAPGQAGDGDRTRTIDGVAVAEELLGKSTSASRSRSRTGSPTPTTIVTFGPNGEPTTTTITPRNSSEHSSRHDDESGHSSTGPGSSDPGRDTGTTDPGNTDTETSSPSGSTSPTDPTETEPSTPTETTGPTGSSSSATSKNQSSGASGGPNTAP